MKKLLFLFATIALLSCSKNDDDNSTPTNGNIVSKSATSPICETLKRNAFDIFLLQIYEYILIMQQKLFLFLNIVAEVNPNTINVGNSIPYINQLFSTFLKYYFPE